VAPHERLRDGSAGVVRHHGHLAEVERLEAIGDDPRHPEQRQIRLAVERDRVAAKGHVQRYAAVLTCELRYDLAPQVAVHRRAVHEHNRSAASALAVLEHAGRYAYCAPLAQGIADRHRRRP
jgi:hypothetical protein